MSAGTTELVEVIPPPVEFVLPTTPAAADKRAGELGQLVNATEWKRAALVFARVYVADGPGRPTEKRNSALLTPKQYAVLGIHGLRSANTVRRYWRMWQRVVEEGKTVPVKLGDRVQLPTADWSKYFAADAVEQRGRKPPATKNETCLHDGTVRSDTGAPVQVPPPPMPGTEGWQERGVMVDEMVSAPARQLPERPPSPQRPYLQSAHIWNVRLHKAEYNAAADIARADKAITQLASIANEEHQAGELHADAQERLTKKISKWRSQISSMDAALERLTRG